MIGRILILGEQEETFSPYNIYENRKRNTKNKSPPNFPSTTPPSTSILLFTKNTAIWRISGSGPRLWRSTSSKRHLELFHFLEKLHRRLWARDELKRARTGDSGSKGSVKRNGERPMEIDATRPILFKRAVWRFRNWNPVALATAREQVSKTRVKYTFMLLPLLNFIWFGFYLQRACVCSKNKYVIQICNWNFENETKLFSQAPSATWQGYCQSMTLPVSARVGCVWRGAWVVPARVMGDLVCHLSGLALSEASLHLFGLSCLVFVGHVLQHPSYPIHSLCV